MYIGPSLYLARNNPQLQPEQGLIRLDRPASDSGPIATQQIPAARNC